MSIGIIGKKIGMTQLFDETGNVSPVTVLQAGPCVVLETLSAGYSAVKLGFGELKASKLNQAEAGYFKKIGKNPAAVVKEFRVDDSKGYNAGDVIDVSLFKEQDFVDVKAVSKGKGFQGVVKRHKMNGGPAAHGSHMGREPGSTGNREHPGRVFKNKRMPGRMGREQVTVQNLRVVKVDPENNLLFLRGPVPGHRSTLVLISKAVKRT